MIRAIVLLLILAATPLRAATDIVVDVGWAT